MQITLEEAKIYLRVDNDIEDREILQMIEMSEQLVCDVIRLDKLSAYSNLIRAAVLYAVAYLYEHREDANFAELRLMLRSLLMDIRKEVF